MSFDEQIIDEKERKQLNKYNINNEMDINTTRMSRCQILLTKIIQLLLLSQKTGWESAVSMRGSQNPEMFSNVYQGQNQDRFILCQCNQEVSVCLDKLVERWPCVPHQPTFAYWTSTSHRLLVNLLVFIFVTWKGLRVPNVHHLNKWINII